MQRIIEKTEDGSATLFVPELNEHYHSVKGARTESQHIFIDMGLKASAATLPHILETAEKEKRPVHYTGIELYPLAWPEVDALKYSDNPLFEELHRAAWEEEVAITPYFTLRKVRADVETISIDSLLMINKSPFDVVYFDAFAPEKQPGMWEEKVFRNIHAAMSTDGVLTTYCAKGVVRRMLQAVGFKVERLPGPPGGKREILRGRKEEVING